MLNDRSSTISLLKTRRSGRPRDMIAPGPNAAELREILEVAIRTPDHGKLFPWRFVHVASEQRETFAELLIRAHRAANPDRTRAEIEAVERFARQAPTLIVALFSPKPSAKIPVWEQQLSCGAACMNLMTAAHALGFTASWITGWATYSPQVLEGFGREGESIAGFIFIGTPAYALEERPRPAFDTIVTDWSPPAPADPSQRS